MNNWNFHVDTTSNNKSFATRHNSQEQTIHNLNMHVDTTLTTTRLGLQCQTPIKKKNLCPCQIRKPQVQKLYFLHPKIVLIEVHYGPEKILGLKKFWSEKILDPKNILGLAKIQGL